MPGASRKAKIVRVKIEEGKTGLFFATSPDLKGLLVAKPTLDALDEAIPTAIANLYLASEVRVVVTKAENDESDYIPWVAVPTEVAKYALENEKQAEQV